MVVPVDSDLANAETELLGQIQDFDVERETGKPLPAEQFFGRAPCEKLEAALSIVQTPDGEDSNHAVEDPAHQMAGARLIEPAGTRGLTGSHRHVEQGSAVSSIEEPVDLLGRHREISITQEAPFGRGFEHPGFHCLALPEVRLFQQPHVRRLCGGLHDDFGGPVRRAVVNDDYLPGVRPAQQVSCDPPDGRPDTRFFVVRGDDNAEEWARQDNLSGRAVSFVRRSIPLRPGQHRVIHPVLRARTPGEAPA